MQTQDVEPIAKAICEAMVLLPNHYFVPDDPLELLLLDDEGMGFMEAALALEKAFEIKLPDDLLFSQKRCIDLVEIIIALRTEK